MNLRVGRERGGMFGEQRSLSIMVCHFVHTELLPFNASSRNAIVEKDVVLVPWHPLCSWQMEKEN